MYYVDIVITLNLFLELPWKFILLVPFKLKRLQFPQVHQFDIRALLFGGYARFIQLDKMVLYD